MIGSGVVSIGDSVFGACHSLTSAYFQGNAPTVIGSNVFYADSVTIYYLPGTTGWGPTTFGGNVPPVEMVLWNPQVQTGDGKFGVQNNEFGFDITGTTNIPIVLEAATNLTAAPWTALQSCTLTNGSAYFSDPNWTNYPSRFYRIRSP